MSQAFILSTPTDKPQAVGALRQSGGQPVRRFRKELIRVGEYRTASDGVEFEVTGDALSHWAATFSDMQEAGIKVPVPAGHSNDPEDNRGWLVDTYVEGDALVGIIDLVGEAGIALAGTSDVSIYSPGEWTDGKGNTYRRPIRHVALCTDPVIPGLSDFVPIAASHKQTPVNVPVLTLSIRKKPNMKLDKVTKALGITQEVTEDNAPDLILSAVGDMTKKRSELEASGVTLVAKVDALQKQLADAGKKPADPDPVTLTLAHENCKLKFDGLVESGKITPAVRDGLQELFIGTDSGALKLSLSSGQGLNIINGLVEVLAKNDPVKLGEQTGKQLVDLQLSQQPDPEKDKAAKETVTKTMRAMAGIKVAV
jgi:hypothetical protein